MTATSLTLTEFLERMIAADEYDVKHGHEFIEDDSSVRGPGWGTIDCRLCDFETFGGFEAACEEQIGEHLAGVHQAARVLAECAAKRAIVETMTERLGLMPEFMTQSDVGARGQILFTLRALASVYADHADFDSRWAS